MILIAVMVIHGSWTSRSKSGPVWELKFNTAAQIALAGFALGVRAFGVSPQPVQTVLVGRSRSTTLASGGVYIAQWLDHMSR